MQCAHGPRQPGTNTRRRRRRQPQYRLHDLEGCVKVAAERVDQREHRSGTADAQVVAQRLGDPHRLLAAACASEVTGIERATGLVASAVAAIPGGDV